MELKKICIFLLTVLATIAWPESPELLLHFDINGTMIAAGWERSLETNLNMYLAKKHKFLWSQDLAEPMTYWEYLENETKSEREQKAFHFLTFLKESDHPLLPLIEGQFNTIRERLSQGKIVFPSFYKLIDHLNSQGICYSVILRTFGEDVPRVAAEINQQYPNFFTFQGNLVDNKLQLDQTYEGPHEIYQFFKECLNDQHHVAIEDDWRQFLQYETRDHGKKFPIDLSDTRILPLFFDDSAHYVIHPFDIQTGHPLDLHELIQSRHIIPADTIEAALNDDYYIQQVQQSIRAHAKLSSEWKRCEDFLATIYHSHPEIGKAYFALKNSLQKAYLSNSLSLIDMKRIISGIEFGAEKHRFQKRNTQSSPPYFIHPLGVADQIMTIGKVYDADILIAALLHDTVEDTETTFDEIRLTFGSNIEGYVRELTDDPSLSTAEQKHMQFLNAIHKSTGAAIVKLSDKYYNLRDFIHNPPPGLPQEKITEYFHSAKKIVNALPPVNEPLKDGLDKVIEDYMDFLGFGFDE